MLSNDNIVLEPNDKKSNINVKSRRKRSEKKHQQQNERKKADDEKLKGANIIFRS